MESTESNLQIQCSPHQNPNVMLHRNWKKSVLKFIWKSTRSQIAKLILSKKSNTGGITVPDFKLYHRAMVTKMAWHWHKNRHVDQWSRLEDSEIYSHSHSHLIFDKRTKIILESNSVFNKQCWQNQTSIWRGLKVVPVSPHTKIKVNQSP
jgi:hypothetical protein